MASSILWEIRRFMQLSTSVLLTKNTLKTMNWCEIMWNSECKHKDCRMHSSSNSKTLQWPKIYGIYCIHRGYATRYIPWGKVASTFHDTKPLSFPTVCKGFYIIPLARDLFKYARKVPKMCTLTLSHMHAASSFCMFINYGVMAHIAFRLLTRNAR